MIQSENDRKDSLFEFVINLQIVGEKKEFREEVRSDFISFSLEDRMDIQLALKEYGYYSTIDGLFGNATFLAVKNYMVENDIVSYKRARRTEARKPRRGARRKGPRELCRHRAPWRVGGEGSGDQSSVIVFSGVPTTIIEQRP